MRMAVQQPVYYGDRKALILGEYDNTDYKQAIAVRVRAPGLCRNVLRRISRLRSQTCSGSRPSSTARGRWLGELLVKEERR